MFTWLITDKEMYELLYKLSKKDINFYIQHISSVIGEDNCIVQYVQEREKRNMILEFRLGTIMLVKEEVNRLKSKKNQFQDLKKFIKDEYSLDRL